MIDSVFRTVNEERRVKLEKGHLMGSDFQIQIEKRHPGFLVRLEKDGRVIQLARAMTDYELPFAAAVLARDHIPDGLNKTAAIRDQF
ncbi:MAG: hypothetical protein KDK41_11775 [Leptospiraceae bacterium]|nr:hypothetical protein [Leptospiraceae bacterium]